MINMSFWKIVKDKWIRDNDPTVDATKDLIIKSKQTREEIDKLNAQLNGLDMSDASNQAIDGISDMLDQLGELGVDDMPFDALFQNLQ